MIAYGHDYPDPLAEPDPDGADVLDEVVTFLARFVSYPSEHARTAHALWIAHTHVMDCWESTPRIAFLSPEPGSGKSRALEVTEPLVPRAVHAVNTSPAYLFRKVSDDAGAPTILYDEIDTVFGPRAKDNEDIRGMLNAGHRKGATAGRCVVRGKIVETEELPAYCAVALAGLNDLPDTIMSRSVVVRMRRRAPGERIEPWRRRINEPQARPIFARLTAWTASVRDRLTEVFPDMPTEVEDRDADVWEALLAVADAAGGTWPARARAAAVAIVTTGKDRAPSLGVLLLEDIRRVFTQTDTDRLSTADLLDKLHELDEAPWNDLRGKPLDSRGLSRRVGNYEIRSAQVWIDGRNVRGYERATFHDAWTRYLPEPTDDTEDVGPSPNGDARSARTASEDAHEPTFPTLLADLADPMGDGPTDPDTCPGCGTPTPRSRAGHRSLCVQCTATDVAAQRQTVNQ